jgi:SulP family sulfate permease
MEWCENRILAEDSRSLVMKAATLRAQLKKIFLAPGQIERFLKYLEREEFDKGHVLMQQGDPPEAMYFVDAGQVSAQLQVEDGQPIRLRSMGGGTVVGEIGLYLHQIRTASIVTDMHSVVYRLQASALARMEKDDPDLASALHHWMARLLAERLSDNNKTLEALLS